MPAALGRRGCKPPNATQAIGPNPVPTEQSFIYEKYLAHFPTQPYVSIISFMRRVAKYRNADLPRNRKF
jgi:hypothetical protein